MAKDERPARVGSMIGEALAQRIVELSQPGTMIVDACPTVVVERRAEIRRSDDRQKVPEPASPTTPNREKRSRGRRAGDRPARPSNRRPIAP